MCHIIHFLFSLFIRPLWSRNSALSHIQDKAQKSSETLLFALRLKRTPPFMCVLYIFLKLRGGRHIGTYWTKILYSEVVFKLNGKHKLKRYSKRINWKGCKCELGDLAGHPSCHLQKERTILYFSFIDQTCQKIVKQNRNSKHWL